MTSILPDRVFQILVTDDDAGDVQLSHSAERNAESLMATYPGAAFRRYRNGDIVEVLERHFSADVLLAYDALIPHAFKADLARYCLLYLHGGLYSDLSYMHLRAIEVEADTDMVVFRDIPHHPSWAVSNAVIYAKAGNEVLGRAIRRIVGHFRTNYRGLSPLDATGPFMFGRCLAKSENWKAIKFGDSVLINRDSGGRANIVKVMPTGEIVAIRNKSLNSAVSELISHGGNSYGALWENGQVWKSQPRKWEHWPLKPKGILKNPPAG